MLGAHNKKATRRSLFFALAHEAPASRSKNQAAIDLTAADRRLL